MPRRDEREVRAEQAGDEDREDEGVHEVHARPHGTPARERPLEDQVHQLRSDERDREADRVADHEPHAGEQVVDERVADVGLEQRDGEDREPDDVRQVAGLAVGAREEDPEEVEDDRRDEDVRRPVVRLPDQEPGSHRERDAHHRRVRLAHVLAAQRRIRAVVDDLAGAVDEEEGEIRAGRDEHDERVERDLPEQERPVVGEEVAERLADERCRAGARVEPADEAAGERCARHVVGFQIREPHHDGPTGSSKVPRARRLPLRSISSGSIGSARPAGPKSTVPPVAGSKVE